MHNRGLAAPQAERNIPRRMDQRLRHIFRKTSAHFFALLQVSVENLSGRAGNLLE
jgi:hypothetical protein